MGWFFYYATRPISAGIFFSTGSTGSVLGFVFDRVGLLPEYSAQQFVLVADFVWWMLCSVGAGVWACVSVAKSREWTTVEKRDHGPMWKYFVNRNKRGGSHPVHVRGCSWLPDPESTLCLGAFGSHEEATQVAKEVYGRVSTSCYRMNRPAYEWARERFLLMPTKMPTMPTNLPRPSTTTTGMNQLRTGALRGLDDRWRGVFAEFLLRHQTT